MPTIFESNALSSREENGAQVVTLANYGMLGTNALEVERITLEEGIESSSFNGTIAERFVYVVRGQGQAHVDKQVFLLNTECVLWLERGETFYLKGGSGGLEALLCQAPASK